MTKRDRTGPAHRPRGRPPKNGLSCREAVKILLEATAGSRDRAVAAARDRLQSFVAGGW